MAYTGDLQMLCTQQHTSVVVFGRTKYTGVAIWQYAGQQAPVFEQFGYLGVRFPDTEGVSTATFPLSTAARRAIGPCLAAKGDQHTSSESKIVIVYLSDFACVMLLC